MQGVDEVATPDARVCVLRRWTCREDVYPPFRDEARRTNHGSFLVARTRLDALCGPARPETS